LRLRDPRRFGAVLWLEANRIDTRLLNTLGIEPLTDEFNARWLKEAWRAEGGDQAGADGQPPRRRHRQHLRVGKPVPRRHRPAHGRPAGFR
jgi:hypothetical protein